MAKHLKVAVIGAGLAGLTTARELHKEGHEVVVYEKGNQIGGMWVYDSRVEEDPLGLDPDRKIIHCSLYPSLRSNLPRCLMGFSDYPFPARKNAEETNFPGHAEVLEFLREFVRDSGLADLIRSNTEVLRVEQVNLRDDLMWLVESKRTDVENSYMELFDAVVVCNGHNTKPNVAHLAGIENWPGKQIHSHNYRHPDPFKDKVVVLIGFAPSLLEISVEVANVAKEIHISTRRPGIVTSKFEAHENIWLRPMVKHCYKNGEITFEEEGSVTADVIIHCTGYNYYFPFLRTNGAITIEDNRVGPLYKHVFPPQLAPRLSFVGIPRQALNLRMIGLQAKWVAQVLSGKSNLPPKEEMLAAVEQFYKQLEERRVPKHHTHVLEFEVVVLIGFAPSLLEISVEVANVAKEIHISTRRPGIVTSKFEAHENIWLRPMVKHCYKNGEITFEEEGSVTADVIIHCTGYNYYFPFLRTNGAITIEDNRVGPLYKHVFPPQLAPRLSFVGIPRQALNLRMIGLQAKWVAQVLSGKSNLPPKEEMLAAVEQFYKQLEERRVPKHHTHVLEFEDKCRYIDWLAAEIGLPPLDKQLKEIFLSIPEIGKKSWTNLRDNFDIWLTQLGF